MKKLREHIRIILAAAVLLSAVVLLWPNSSTQMDCSKPARRIHLPLLQKESEAALPAPVLNHFSNSYFDSTLAGDTVQVIQGDTFRTEHTINTVLQNRIYQLMRRYHPRCGAAVVMNPKTGQVLAAVSYRNENEAEFLPEVKNLLLWGEFPAASLFKMVTTAGAIEYGLMNQRDELSVTGNYWTLYKQQLTKESPKRWSKLLNIREAFARSINPFFGKVGVHILGSDRLNASAGRFLFNQTIPFELSLSPSRYIPPKDFYETAQLACGFNRLTTITPLHGAMIAGAFINSGQVRSPWMFRSVSKNGTPVYEHHSDTLYTLMTSNTANETRQIMSEVIRIGTARKGFAQIKRDASFNNFQMGGKTGSLDGENPRGRCDWFTGYAVNPKNPDDAISVAIVTVHGAWWTVHSSYLGAEAIRCYFNQKKTYDLGNGRTISAKRSSNPS